MKRLCLLPLFLLTAAASAADLSGNWVIATPNNNDGGSYRRTYLNLKQEGDRITGSIRTTQFYYQVVESKSGPDGFTLTGSMQDGHSERRATYEVKLVGDELHVGARRNRTSPLTEMVAASRSGKRGRHPGPHPAARAAQGPR